ncbi:hypothetical protein EJO50_14415 [Iodobacter ciconiae]|uniref:Integrase catalytic domain-containing protein n=1 Tax=Iodobacter ciconiae TaxID=2496266 RepID=A0A3S8ZXL4_9NEIS|nr:hypothetical protein EJO50_14415 [Iodobacter ciconiae]
MEKGIVEYIHYYNHDRIKLKLKELSPAQSSALECLTFMLFNLFGSV